jgi:hypothetical protein
VAVEPEPGDGAGQVNMFALAAMVGGDDGPDGAQAQV